MLEQIPKSGSFSDDINQVCTGAINRQKRDNG